MQPKYGIILACFLVNFCGPLSITGHNAGLKDMSWLSWWLYCTLKSHSAILLVPLKTFGGGG